MQLAEVQGEDNKTLLSPSLSQEALAQPAPSFQRAPSPPPVRGALSHKLPAPEGWAVFYFKPTQYLAALT